MNFGKTEYAKKPFIKSIKLSNPKIYDPPVFRKLIPSFSCTNYFQKSKNNSIFLRTQSQINFDKINFVRGNNLLLKKIRLKKSSSSIFQNNDVDLVRNLNFDSLAQYIDNTQLRENLISSLKDSIIEINDNNEKKENEEIQLPRLAKLAKYKSYEIIQSHKKKIKNEMSEQLQKELLNKLKSIQNDSQMKKLEKDKIFLKIQDIEEQLKEIDAENHYFKEQFKKQINDITKKRKESPEKRQEIIRARFKTNFDKKKKKVNKGNLMDIFKVDKKENNKNQQNNNNTPEALNYSGVKNESPKLSEKKLIDNNKQLLDTSNSIKEEERPHDQKKLENFEINLLQTQRKKEYENFQKSQEDKIKNLKEDWKKLDVELNQIDLYLEENKKKEKKITNKLMTFYKELLFKGKNVKKDGLVWIIKAMWNLGENVPMSFMPEFLDFDSIDYLFKLAHKQLEIENCHKKIKEIKLKLKNKISYKYNFIKLKTISDNKSKDFNESNVLPSTIKEKIFMYIKNESQTIDNENKKDVYRDLLKEFEEKNLQFEIINMPEVLYINNIRKHIEQIESDIIELKKREIQRIYRCFIEFDYENKFHTTIETVLSALIGIDAKDTEMNKYNIIKKDYISRLKKIRFFDHEHIRKILSK